MLIFVVKIIREEQLSQRLQTNNNRFKTGVNFLTVYNGNFNVTNSNIKFYFIVSITDKDGYIQIVIPPGAYEIESLNHETKRIFKEGE